MVGRIFHRTVHFYCSLPIPSPFHCMIALYLNFIAYFSIMFHIFVYLGAANFISFFSSAKSSSIHLFVGSGFFFPTILLWCTPFSNAPPLKFTVTVMRKPPHLFVCMFSHRFAFDTAEKFADFMCPIFNWLQFHSNTIEIINPIQRNLGGFFFRCTKTSTEILITLCIILILNWL